MSKKCFFNIFPKQNMWRIYFYLIGTIFFMLACTKQIEIELPAHDAQPVINCLFKPDSTILIYYSHSGTINEKTQEKNTPIEIFLYENNQAVFHKSHFTDTLLSIFHKPKPLYTYTLEIKTQNGETIVAADTIPNTINMRVSGFKPNVGFDAEGYRFSEFTIEIMDLDASNDFYEIGVVSKNSSLGKSKNYVWSNEAIIANEGDAGFYYYNIVLADELFNGENITLTCFTNFDEEDEDVYICLRSISLTYYKYKKSVMRHFANMEGDIWMGSGNPVNVYSNLSGAYGIFAGYQETIDTIFMDIEHE